MKNVIKRDGREVKFDPAKIVTAIEKAMESCGIQDNEFVVKVAMQIEKKKDNFTVEEIQDIIEKKLMSSNYKDVAKAFILYREHRDKMRGRKQTQVWSEIINADANDITRENANMNADTPSGMMYKFGSETSKKYTVDELLSENTKEAVRTNHIHIHDMDYYPTKSLTCLQHPLDKILSEGFRAGHGSSRPAKRIETASMLAAISLETIQNEMHGGQAIPAWDFYMSPYVRATFEEEFSKVVEVTRAYDGTEITDQQIKEVEVDEYEYVENPTTGFEIAVNRTIKRVHQAMEAFIHNMNTIHSRGGNQVVFSSINFGTDTSAEGRLIIRETLNCIYEGVGNGETAIFPISIFKLKKGVSAEPGDPNFDLLELACKVTAKRFFPNYLNLDAPFNQHPSWDANDPKRYLYEVATMGCRTRVFSDVTGVSTSVGRGNLSFTTINLPRIALESETLEQFYEGVELYTIRALEQLRDRYAFQRTALKKQFPLLMSGMWKGSAEVDNDECVGDLLRTGTMSVGFIGLAEALIKLTGKHHGESAESQEIGLKTIQLMNDICELFSHQYKLNFSVIATPAEGLSGKFVKKDREEFGIIEGVTDKEYYTNSNHIPVWYKCSYAHKLEIEAPYHPLTPAGHISYLEVDGDPEQNITAVIQIVNLIRKYNIGYGSINFSRARCLDCGHEDNGQQFEVCPKCGSANCDVIERVTGYLVGSVNRWNNGKKAELRDRISHMSGEKIIK